MKKYTMPQYVYLFPQHFTVAEDSISQAHDAAPLTHSGVSKAVCALHTVTPSSQPDCHENFKTRTACDLCRKSVYDTNYREVSDWLWMVIREIC
jgi:hypothetical protein